MQPLCGMAFDTSHSVDLNGNLYDSTKGSDVLEQHMRLIEHVQSLPRRIHAGRYEVVLELAYAQSAEPCDAAYSLARQLQSLQLVQLLATCRMAEAAAAVAQSFLLELLSSVLGTAASQSH